MKSDGWQRARTAEQRAERERQILESAERLFADLGYERVTMQMIAREIGVSQSFSVLYHFHMVAMELV